MSFGVKIETEIGYKYCLSGEKSQNTIDLIEKLQIPKCVVGPFKMYLFVVFLLVYGHVICIVLIMLQTNCVHIYMVSGET